MSQAPYEEIIEYHFTVEGELLVITESGADFVCVEEARKNGQEDTHMCGVLVCDDSGKFSWDEGESMFRRYHSQALADGIREYLDKYGTPTNLKNQ